jgi:hypothetical protein
MRTAAAPTRRLAARAVEARRKRAIVKVLSLIAGLRESWNA